LLVGEVLFLDSSVYSDKFFSISSVMGHMSYGTCSWKKHL
jgi:hypothetical protein